jgi:hypothetical protein
MAIETLIPRLCVVRLVFPLSFIKKKAPLKRLISIAMIRNRIKYLIILRYGSIQAADCEW